MWSLSPGEEQTNILVPLKKEQKRQRKQPLGFREGKHTLRFALRLSPDDKGQPVSIISNPVKIEILPEEKPDEEVEGEGVI